MKRIFVVSLLIINISVVFGQSKDNNSFKNLGISYFGELGLKPGMEIDYGIPLWIRENPKDNKKRFLSQQLSWRPAFAYYFYAHNSNNFLFSSSFNYQFRFINNSNQRYLSIEPYLKVGFLRKSFLGEIFKTTELGFEAVNSAGSNALTLGGGINFGGYLSKKIDWLVGIDYFIERSNDQLNFHRFVAKIGTRIKLNAL